MKILVVGKKIMNLKKKDGSGTYVACDIYGIVTEPDSIDDNIEGNEVFSEFMKDPSALNAEINQEYNVIYAIRKFKGENVAYANKLVPVTT